MKKTALLACCALLGYGLTAAGAINIAADLELSDKSIKTVIVCPDENPVVFRYDTVELELCVIEEGDQVVIEAQVFKKSDDGERTLLSSPKIAVELDKEARLSIKDGEEVFLELSLIPSRA